MAMIGRALQRLIASPAIAGDAARTTAAAAGLCRHVESSVLAQRGALSGGGSAAHQNYSTNNSGSGNTGVESDRARNSNPDAQQMTFPMSGTLNKVKSVRGGIDRSKTVC
ncbi:hypothetical protein CBR_g23767 [Chara braunii]|uniref:Uncharacterized protein n=1 Tax=Chara braunii TaxID=69332 RepID=A0A388JVG4_CHABU|nr:hypothetical protein CBR_g23767 [Chara braunii]|eukprot:GBG61809.1 hypothetical protein CBR_g23767 [Chara braunii]